MFHLPMVFLDLVVIVQRVFQANFVKFVREYGYSILTVYYDKLYFIIKMIHAVQIHVL